MATRSTAKDQTQSDWSNYDFRTWDPGKIPGDTVTTITGTALRGLIASPDWPTNLASGVSSLEKTLLLPALNAYSGTLGKRGRSLDSDLANATSAAQQQMSALQESLRSAASPPQPAADSSSYQVAAKVVDQESKVGLPGIPVAVVNGREASVSLVSATTDLAGNATLKLTAQQITGVESALVLQVAVPGGKQIFSAQLCPKINHIDTVVAPIAAIPELSQQLDLANLALGQQRDLITAITAHVDAMKMQTAQAKTDLQQELDQLQGIIDDLK